MEIIEWSERYVVGNPVMDAQHQIFFQMVESAVRAVGVEGTAAARQRVGFLMDYAIDHFATEERLMREAGYPDFDAHQAQHAHFRSDVAALQRQIDALPPDALTDAVVRFAHAFLTTHILGDDMKLASWFREHRAGESHAARSA